MSASFDPGRHPRNPAGSPAGGKFAEKQNTDPDVAVTLADGAREPVNETGARVFASIQREWWDGDQAVPMGPPVDVDVTDIVEQLPQGSRNAIRDHDDSSDALYWSAVITGSMEPHDGPFSVEVRDALDRWELERVNPDNVPEVSAVRDNVKVSAVYLGEGSFGGDYDPDDPDNDPLVRVDVYAKPGTVDDDLLDDPDFEGEWSSVSGASWCTTLDVRRGVEPITRRVEDLADRLSAMDADEWASTVDDDADRWGFYDEDDYAR